ncbi:MAG: hypothetical protein U0U66_12845 [Cytophagaceae bacterium]
MIKEFNYPDREWSLFISNVDLNYYLKFIKIFEKQTLPIEKVVRFWHDTNSEFILAQIPNNKIIIEFSEEILTIKFAEISDEISNEISKKELKLIVEMVEILMTG